jgi:hypothetical protein
LSVKCWRTSTGLFTNGNICKIMYLNIYTYYNLSIRWPLCCRPIDSIRLRFGVFRESAETPGFTRLKSPQDLEKSSWLSFFPATMPVAIAAPRTLYDKIWDDHVVWVIKICIWSILTLHF